MALPPPAMATTELVVTRTTERTPLEDDGGAIDGARHHHGGRHHHLRLHDHTRLTIATIHIPGLGEAGTVLRLAVESHDGRRKKERREEEKRQRKREREKTRARERRW